MNEIGYRIPMKARNMAGELVTTVYSISQNGDIYRNEKKINPSFNQKGYLHVSIRIENYQRTSVIHRLVADNYIPNPLKKPQVNHKDGKKANNNASNLEWVTASENIKHSIANGLTKFSESQMKNLKQAATVYSIAKSVLTVEMVSDIRIKAKNKHYGYFKSLLAEYNICSSSLWEIITNRTWKNLN